MAALAGWSGWSLVENRVAMRPSYPSISFHQIPSGFYGTLETASHVARLIRQGAKDFHVRQTAIDILIQRGVRAKDYAGEINALFEWVQDNVRYTRDTVHVEVIHSARRMLEVLAGDCDDFTILLGAMLEGIGHPVRLILTGTNPEHPDRFSHIYLEAFGNGRWIPLDATMPYAMGWAPRALVKKIIEIDRRRIMMGEEVQLQGLGADKPVPDWLRALVRAVRGEAMQPKDAKVKSLWDLLRSRQLLASSPWLKGVLRQIWDRGLPARPRPRTTAKMVASLRHSGILPPGGPRRPLAPAQPVRPVALRAVGTARPAPMRAVRPASPHAARQSR